MKDLQFRHLKDCNQPSKHMLSRHLRNTSNIDESLLHSFQEDLAVMSIEVEEEEKHDEHDNVYNQRVYHSSRTQIEVTALMDS